MNTIQTCYGYVSCQTTYTSGTSKTGKSENLPKKPEWNPNHVYRYLEDMNQGFQSYRKEAVSYYEALIAGEEGDGTLTMEELKQQIQEYFPEYTLTDKEPSEVKTGVYYLYIDEKNLQRLMSDPDYRAKVYGLMDTELQGKKGYTLQYSDGRNVTSHLTGSIFSLAEKNKKYAGADGIPYLGSCTSDHPFSSSDSHPQVRSMSYLYDNIDPAKSAAKDRRNNASDITAKRIAKTKKKRLEEKKRKERLQEKKEQQERIEKRQEETKARETQLLEKWQERADQMKTGSKYRSAEDIKNISGTGNKYQSLSDFTSYLADNYRTYGNGITTVSKTFLRECMTDDEKRSKLEQMLAEADAMEEDAKKNVKGYQGMKIHIDAEGNMETETYGGSVSFPEGKRAAQIEASMSESDIQSVMGLLSRDLAECESGVDQGLCDETEVQKVKSMIQKAEEKMRQLSGTNTEL